MRTLRSLRIPCDGQLHHCTVVKKGSKRDLKSHFIRIILYMLSERSNPVFKAIHGGYRCTSQLHHFKKLMYEVNLLKYKLYVYSQNDEVDQLNNDRKYLNSALESFTLFTWAILPTHANFIKKFVIFQIKCTLLKFSQQLRSTKRNQKILALLVHFKWHS